MRNGSFAVYLHDECISKQLAMSFLKFPLAQVKGLLQAWARYMKSPEHERERLRAAPVDPGNAAAVAEKERQVGLKKKGYMALETRCAT